jgi:hypothetical protein
MPLSQERKQIIGIECPRCEGTGGVVCTKCDGAGVEVSPANSIDIYRNAPLYGPLYDVTESCPRCYGMKEIGCPTCDAIGAISWPELLQ